ncbi:MAG: hypothetical protein GH150_04800 [Hadesarchaea archaeon]|nr:hypothetical protein [Hadesarchaea archaeon]
MAERLSAHISEGDFIRTAIREKIQRDCPNLYDSLFKKGKEASPIVRGKSQPRRPAQSRPRPEEV